MKKTTGIKLFFFVFYNGLGLMIAYMTVYMRDNLKFSGSEIGLITALFPFFSIFSQIFAGFLSDLTKRIRIFIYLSLTGTLITVVLMFFVKSFGAFFILFGFYSIFLSLLFPVVNIAILETLGPDKHDYGKLRMWSTLGFLCSTTLLPFLISYTGKQYIFLLYAFFLLLTLLTVRIFPERELHKEGFTLKDLKHLKNFNYLITIIIVLIFQTSYNALDTYLGILLSSLKAPDELIGYAWAISVVAEIPVMYYSGTILKKLGVKFMLGLGIVSGIIRWLIYANSTSIPVIMLAQLLHGFTFCTIYNAGVYFVSHTFKPQMQGTAQSIYDSASRFSGYLIGSLVLGRVFDKSGVQSVFETAAWLAGVSLLFLLVSVIVNKIRKNTQSHFEQSEKS